MTDKLPETIETKASGKKAGRLAKPIETVRHAAADAAEKTAQAIEGNPMSVLVGGLAIGVIAGALIPRGKKESELLRPVTSRLRDGASIALKAARDAGAAELAAAGLSRINFRQQVNKLIDTVGQVAARAGDAATEAAAKIKVGKTEEEAAPAPKAKKK